MKNTSKIHTYNFKKSVNLLLLASTIIFLLIRIKLHYTAIETDIGQYAYGAQQILKGALPYREFHLNKPPGILLIFATTFILMGETTVAIKTMATVFLLLSAILIYLISTKIFSKQTSSIIYSLYLLSISLPFIQTIHANTEIFFIPFVLFSIWILLQNPPRKNFIAGLSLGIAMIIKPIVISNILAINLWYLINSSKNKYRNLLIFSIGWSIPILLTLLALQTLGILNDFWFSNFIFNKTYIASSPLLSKIFTFQWRVFLENPSLWILGLIGSFSIWFIPKSQKKLNLQLIALNAFVTLLTIQWVGKGFGHYYIQTIPFLLLMAMYQYQKISTKLNKPLKLTLIWIILIIPTLILIKFITIPSNKMLTFARSGERGEWIDQSPTLANDIKQEIKPGDYIYNLGREGQIYFYTKARSPSKFLTDQTFYYFPETVETVCQDLAKNKPKLIINTLKKPYFPERYQQQVWQAISKCGNLEVYKKKQDNFAEIWWIK